ncbi:hypothetical protein AB9G22_09010 [Francisella philomiragia]|uniref:hypothetical protein n=1 Tax=Francisella philomiragia TaxID=28110 RepID=UPI0035111EAF
MKSFKQWLFIITIVVSVIGVTPFSFLEHQSQLERKDYTTTITFLGENYSQITHTGAAKLTHISWETNSKGIIFKCPNGYAFPNSSRKEISPDSIQMLSSEHQFNKKSITIITTIGEIISDDDQLPSQLWIARNKPTLEVDCIPIKEIDLFK